MIGTKTWDSGDGHKESAKRFREARQAGLVE